MIDIPSKELPKPFSFLSIVRQDLYRYDPPDLGWRAMLLYILKQPGFRAVFLFRVAALLHTKGAFGKLLGLLTMNVNLMLHGCSIPPYASIGPGLLLPHPVGIEVGYTRIGSNVTLMQRISFGVRKQGQGYEPFVGRPVIGNHVKIMPGAVVTGDLQIGDHAVIGANCVVLQNVPPHSRAEGIPARIIKSKS